MGFDPLSAAFDLGGKVLDKVLPDKGAREAAKLKMMELKQQGEFKTIETKMSAIIAEAKSADPWTSRARPSFLYVIYIMILASIPMGILSAFSPDTATAIAKGMQSWLAAVPAELWTVFGVGYTGYTVSRSAWDKKKLDS